MTFDDFAKKHHIAIQATKIKRRPDRGDRPDITDEWNRTADHWKCELFDSTSLGLAHTAYYSAGPAHNGLPPTVGGLLECLACDCRGRDGYDSVGEWADELCYDSFAKAEKDWAAIRETETGLRLLLGEEYSAFLECEEE